MDLADFYLHQDGVVVDDRRPAHVHEVDADLWLGGAGQRQSAAENIMLLQQLIILRR